MRLHFFSVRHNEKTFKDSHRRKAFQMQPMWSWIFTSWAFNEAHSELWKQGQNIKQTSEKATTHWKYLRNGKKPVMHFKGSNVSNIEFCLLILSKIFLTLFTLIFSSQFRHIALGQPADVMAFLWAGGVAGWVVCYTIAYLLPTNNGLSHWRQYRGRVPIVGRLVINSRVDPIVDNICCAGSPTCWNPPKSSDHNHLTE